MIPAKAGKPSLNPRELVVAGGAGRLAECLAGTGYMIQHGILRDMVQAIKAGAPHLIEGQRGSGKTALAEALAEGCNLPVFYLQGMKGLQLEEVLYTWDKDSQAAYVRQAVESGMPLAEARASQWSEEYLVLGEALAAFDYAAKHKEVPILIIDEIDKLTDSIEDMLLQLFGRGIAHVPRFGNVGVQDRSRWPIVVLLSNNIRHDLSAPLRSRCVYSFMDLPTAQERVVILKTRVPGASATQVRYVAKLLFWIESIPGVVDKPALREGIVLLEAWVRDQVSGRITEEILLEYLCLIAKRENDRRYLTDAAARLEKDINSVDGAIDRWVDQEFGTARLELVA
jgi:MoxR-like ATPase